MNKKITVRVVKRDERRQLHEKQETKNAGVEKRKTPEAAHDIVATVTGWVNDFHQKRRTETAQAFKNLFSDSAPQPTKA